MKQILVQFFQELGLWAIPASIMINALINIIGFIPSVFVTLANVWMWGPFLGGVISWLGELLGSAAAFFLYSKGIQKTVRNRHVNWKWMKSLRDISPLRQTIALTLLRINPFIPAGAVHLLGSLAGLSWTVFLIATAIGKIPSIAMEVWISLGLIHIGEQTKWAIALISLIALYLAFKKSKRDIPDGRRKNHGEKTASLKGG